MVEALLPGGQVLRMWSRGDDEIASIVFWRGWAGHEAETVLPFYELAASARVTLDVGAHVGYFALLASLANPRGRVFAFEPLPRVRDRLVRNVAINHLAVTCPSQALGDAPGTARFYHLKDGIPSSSSLSQEFMQSIAEEDSLTSLEIDVMTVDDFVDSRNIKGVDLVKIDTEATEDQVLMGMTRTLERDRPAVVCEVLPKGPADAIEAILAPLEYEYFLLTADGPVRYDHIRPDEKWRNYLFTPRRGLGSRPGR